MPVCIYVCVCAYNQKLGSGDSSGLPAHPFTLDLFLTSSSSFLPTKNKNLEHKKGGECRLLVKKNTHMSHE